jgi:adhesin/invasin
VRKNFNLKIISAFVTATLSWGWALGPAYATDTLQTSNVIDSDKIIELKNGTKAREMRNNQKRSLYQIALLSNISIDELREMNAGRFDKKNVVDVDERLVLPINSPLLPAINKNNENGKDKHANLPMLGSDESYDVKQDKDALATQVASTLQTLATQDWKSIMSSENGGISGHLKNQGKNYAENYVRNSIQSQVVNPVRTAAQDFLGRFGTAQLQFDLSDKAQFDNINLKLFSPWIDTEKTLIFTQISFQEYEHNRYIGNFGIGQRWEVADNKWLLGYNAFIDHDFQRKHNRLGLGAEAWSDYMKFSANYYHPLSDWKNSRDFDDYLERAAKGFDIRFQGYLPQYPHLGGSLMYEKYYGDKVALFGKDNLQKNPSAVTVGLDYTPVPLFTVKAQHKRGQEGQKATSAELTLNYRIGTPLKDQLDPDMVQAARSLKGSRYDLVDRNNYIVLEYKEKQMSVDLGLESVRLLEGSTHDLTIGLHNAKGISSIAWSGNMQEIDLAGGFLCSAIGVCTSSSWMSPPADVENWKIVAPSYLDANGQRQPVNTNGVYSLALTVTDSRGKTAKSNSVSFEVLPNLDIRKVGVWAIDTLGNKSTTISNRADGMTAVTLLASLVTPTTPTGNGNFGDGYDGFSDQSLMNKINTTFKSSVTDLWTATSNGTKLALIDGTSGNVSQCPTSDPCVIIKSFEKVQKGSNVSANAATGAGTTVLGDTYTLDVASNFNGVVDFSIKLDGYGQSFNHTSVNFTGGQPGFVTVYRVSDGTLIARQNGNVLDLEPGIAGWIVGEEYKVKAYVDNTETVEVLNPYIIWSLVGSNSAACPGAATTLPSHITHPTGPWFNVNMGIDATYTIRTNNNSYATSGTSISAAPGAPSSLDLTAQTAAPLSCAGDQGFKLQVSVY